MIPGWCHHVNVRYNVDSNNEYMAEVVIQYEYRWATIKISPAFFDNETLEHQVQYLGHEMVHIVMAPAMDMIQRLMKGLVNRETREGSLLYAEYVAAVEQTTQDLCYLLYGNDNRTLQKSR